MRIAGQAGTVHAKGAAARGAWVGGSGGMLPQEFLNFRRSEINSGAFLGDFPQWQGTRTNCNRCCKSVTLRRTIVIELRPNLDRIIPAAP